MDNQEIVCHSKQQLKILNKFRKRLEKEKYINNYASNYYGNMHNRFSIPGIIVSGISSVASFLATNDMMTETGKTAISIGVGILAAGSTIIYSIANSYGFQSRRDSFQMSADAYDDLITRIEFEIVNPNEDFNEFCNTLETQILKIKTDCKYLPPLFIYKMYEEEARKMKLAGMDEEKEASLDFVMSGADNSNASDNDIKTIINVNKPRQTTNNTDKKIRLPSIAGLTEKIGVSGNLATYFNDLSGMGTTVNKLSADTLQDLSSVITIPNQNILPRTQPFHINQQQQLGANSDSVSINVVNADSAEMDGESSV